MPHRADRTEGSSRASRRPDWRRVSKGRDFAWWVGIGPTCAIGDEVLIWRWPARHRGDGSLRGGGFRRSRARHAFPGDADLVEGDADPVRGANPAPPPREA